MKRIFGWILTVYGFFTFITNLTNASGSGGLILAVVGLLLLRSERNNRVFPLRAEPGRIYEIDGDFERIYCRDWVVLDVETTGLDPEKGHVVEVAARKFIDGEPVDTFQSLVNPQVTVPRKTTELTGIRSRDVRTAPKFPDIAEELREFLGDLPMVAHNAKFDARYIVIEFARAGITFNVRIIDTVRMARWTYPGLQNYKLATLIDVFQLLDHGQDHRALSDVEATAKLYELCRLEQAHRRKRSD